MKERMTTALKEEETEHLKVIYKTRLKNFIFIYTILVLTGLYFSLPNNWGDNSTRYYYKNYREKAYDYEIAGHVLTHSELSILIGSFFELIIVSTGLALFFKRIWPFQKDIRSGEKEVVFYTITNKLYFPTTGQYFFSLNDPSYLHHDVMPELYNSLEIGDEIHIYRCVYSKYVFEKDARFTMI
jgi:hypothetical protein